MSSHLISDSYRIQQARLHAAHEDYGVASVLLAPLVADVAKRIGARELLDYGAGKQRLAEALHDRLGPSVPIHAYDPAIPAISAVPAPADLVVCLDVLEHIEPEKLDAVVADLHGLTKRLLLASIASTPSRRILEDGRNAHLIQQPMEWWLPNLWQKFRVTAFNQIDDSRFWLTAVPRA